MTHLRQTLLDGLQRRNYAQNTAEAYIYALREFAAYYHRPPDKLGPKEIMQHCNKSGIMSDTQSNAIE